MSERPRVVCLVGPTATGKSALGVELAERLDAEIVSADSRQVIFPGLPACIRPTWLWSHRRAGQKADGSRDGTR